LWSISSAEIDAPLLDARDEPVPSANVDDDSGDCND